MDEDVFLSSQAALVLLGRIGQAELARLLVRSRLETIESLKFVLAVISGEPKATGMAIGALAPVEKREPRPFVLEPRLLFLAPTVRQVSPRRSRWMATQVALQSCRPSGPHWRAVASRLAHREPFPDITYLIGSGSGLPCQRSRMP